MTRQRRHNRVILKVFASQSIIRFIIDYLFATFSSCLMIDTESKKFTFKVNISTCFVCFARSSSRNIECSWSKNIEGKSWAIDDCRSCAPRDCIELDWWMIIEINEVLLVMLSPHEYLLRIRSRVFDSWTCLRTYSLRERGNTPENAVCVISAANNVSTT